MRGRPLSTPATHLASWENSLTYNRRVLLDPRFRLPTDLVRYIDRAQRAFLRWHRMEASLHDGRSELLFAFYRCHRAMLRARLAIAHLLEPNPRREMAGPGESLSGVCQNRRDADRAPS